MEAATNAVRHGFAAHVHAVYAKEGTEWYLTVTNDGIPPAGPVREGGGLTQIRTEVEKAGGCFLIQPAPSFCLHVKLPGGDTK